MIKHAIRGHYMHAVDIDGTWTRRAPGGAILQWVALCGVQGEHHGEGLPWVHPAQAPVWFCPTCRRYERLRFTR